MKAIVTPRMQGLTPADHATLVNSFQSITPAIQSAVQDAIAGTSSHTQVSNLQQLIAALQAQISATNNQLLSLQEEIDGLGGGATSDRTFAFFIA
jgi:peptidoglycan hydrolase CwlO-like protein